MDKASAFGAYMDIVQFGADAIIIGLLTFILAIGTMGVYTLNKIYHQREDALSADK